MVICGEVGPYIQGCQPLEEQDLEKAGFARQDMVVVSWGTLGKSYSFGGVQTILQSVHRGKTRGGAKMRYCYCWFGLP